MSEQEKVLCVKRELIDQCGAFQGIRFHRSLDSYTALRDPANAVYLPKDQAELDETHKQLIPYVVVLQLGATAEEAEQGFYGQVKVFRYRRGKSGGESRLHGKWSVGIGGHICDADGGGDTAYDNGMLRELNEELGIKTMQHESLPQVAVLNEDITPVGRVHFGMVHTLLIGPEDTHVATCKDLVDLEAVPFHEATRNLDMYELWSRYCLESLPWLFAAAIQNSNR